MNRIVYGLLTVLLVSLAWCGTSLAAEEAADMELSASNLKISTFYNGTTLDVSGSLPEDGDVVVRVSGPKKNVHLKEKGKVAGVLWMNKTDVSLENTPAVYMVYTPAGPVESFLSPELGVGYKALVNNIDIVPESADKAFIFGEYVKLMEKSGVYAVENGAVTYGAAAGGMKAFSATLTIPSKMNAGDYKIDALVIKNGAVTTTLSKNLNLELSGFPKLISDLAYGSPLLFGILAVVIAIGTGLLIGVIFKGGGGAH